jgi:geranylgeranyl pyrophosphate synthase
MDHSGRFKNRIEEEVPFRKIDSVLSSKLGRSPSSRNIVSIILKYDEKILTDGGKRVRIAIPFLMAEGLDLDLREFELIEALIPIEIYHGASLIMDDVIDQDGMRRGMDTPHQKLQDYGFSQKQAESITILDAAEIQSISVTASHQMEFLSAEQRIAISRIVQNSISDISRSQILDISAENTLDKGFKENLQCNDKPLEFEEFYIELIEGKTVSLFEASVEILEVISGENLRYLSKYMSELGKAFQIRDDILDVIGGEEEINIDQHPESDKIGKDRYSDLKEGSMTLPIFYGLEMARQKPLEKLYEGQKLDSLEDKLNIGFKSRKQFLEAVLEDNDPKDLSLCVAAKILEDCGAIEKAQNKAEKHADKAARHLKKSDLTGKHLDILEKAAHYVATRTR